MLRIHQIKVLQAQGCRISEIADGLDRDRKTVRKYLLETDFSEPAPVTQRRKSKLDPYQAAIDAWLEEDAHHWHKQRHTAQRISDQLAEEFPERTVSHRTVRRYVQARRRRPCDRSVCAVPGPLRVRDDLLQLVPTLAPCSEHRHYGFETTFCNPYVGYEKGTIEDKVGYLRRNLLVPAPTVSDLVAMNHSLLTRSERHWARPHYIQKGHPRRDPL